jgi:hypothetical protein
VARDGVLALLFVRAALVRTRADLVEPTFFKGLVMEVANSGPKTGPERTVQTAMATNQRRFMGSRAKDDEESTDTSVWVHVVCRPDQPGLCCENKRSQTHAPVRLRRAHGLAKCEGVGQYCRFSLTCYTRSANRR